MARGPEIHHTHKGQLRTFGEKLHFTFEAAPFSRLGWLHYQRLRTPTMIPIRRWRLPFSD